MMLQFVQISKCNRINIESIFIKIITQNQIPYFNPRYLRNLSGYRHEFDQRPMQGVPPRGHAFRIQRPTNCGLLTHIFETLFPPPCVYRQLGHASSSETSKRGHNVYSTISRCHNAERVVQPPLSTLLRKGWPAPAPASATLHPPTRPLAIGHMTC